MQYVGCFVDNGQRALPGGFHGLGNTPDPIETCRDLCEGFSHFSLQWYAECFCGNEYDRYGEASEADCNTPCRGNGDVMCGGGWRNSVYEAISEPRGYAQAGAFLTADVVTHDDHLIAFAEPFRDVPAIFMSIATTDGGDPSHLRLNYATSSGASLMIQEERCSDSETRHTTERVSIIVVELGLIGVARPAPAPSGICTSCSNGEKDGDEVSIDCGGGTCPACADGAACNVDSDCRNSRCHLG
eukprot:SAG11_NODE_9059_length_948_cov_1.259128_1_plen_242_part_01